MADSPLPCRVCGIELPDPSAPSADWHAATCPACGEVAVICRGPVACSACGIEYHCESAWLEDDVVVARCPICGSTAAIRHPEPHTPEPEPVVSAPAVPDSPAEEPTEAPPAPSAPPEPHWPTPPWPPTPREPKIPENADAMHAGAMVALAVTGFYVLACLLPAIRFGPEEDYVVGIICLLLGWLACYLWFPNPLMFFGCIALLRGRNRQALVFGMLSCLCSAPLMLGIDHLGARSKLSWGYYVWQADIFLLTISSWILLKRYGPRVARPRR